MHNQKIWQVSDLGPLTYYYITNLLGPIQYLPNLKAALTYFRAT